MFGVAKLGSGRHVMENAPEQEKKITSEKQQSQIFILMKEIACDCKGLR